MYNHYLDDLDNGGFVLLDPAPQGSQTRPGPQHQSPGPGQSQHRPGASPRHPGRQSRPAEPVRSKNDLVGEVTQGLSQLLDGVLKRFSLEKFDTGDILLVLIILFLYLEDGDNLELVITLGLLLLLGLDEDKPE